MVTTIRWFCKLLIKFDTCNSSIYSTREGFFVSNDSKLLVPISKRNFNIIEHFTLSDIDSKYVQLFVLLQNKLAYKLCLFLNMLIDLQRYRIGYFKITDLQANEIIVHSDGYNLRIANFFSNSISSFLSFFVSSICFFS